ncbi:MAG: hypothetical protein IIU86_04480, partial [Oscillospiraceae bacterium]|nr:hypothetical protein [Oscillospiraceae bacterium]
PGKTGLFLQYEGAHSAHPSFCLAAAAVVVAAAVVIAAQQVTATAVAEQNDNQNNPANITATETVIVTHNQYLRNFLR